MRRLLRYLSIIPVLAVASWGAVSWPDQIALGEARFGKGLYRDAVREYEAALPLAPAPFYRGVTLYRLALAHTELAEFPEGERCYKQALGLFRSVGDSSNVATTLTGLGEIYRIEHRLDDALQVERSAYKELKLAGMAASRAAASALGTIGTVLLEQHHLKAAEDSIRESLATLEKVTPPEDPAIATDLNNLAVVEFAGKHFAESEALLLRALKIREARFAPEHPLIASTLLSLSSVYLQEKRYDEAEGICRRSVEMARHFFPADHPDVIRGQMELAMVARGKGDAAGAAAILGRARESLSADRVTAESVQLTTLYAQYLHDAGEGAKARQAEVEARLMLRNLRVNAGSSTVSVSELQASGFHE